ncbi:MAG: NAD-dependent epimerase/dehydratase family protein [Pseudomonadota bacterium]
MILVTGATGFLGKRICRRLNEIGLEYAKTSLSLGLDLRNKQATVDFFHDVQPDYILNCAAFVGGIQFGYKYPVDIFQNNLTMTLNLLEAAHRSGVKRVVNPISNCAYPARASLFKESEFWDGPLHESVLVYGFVRKASWVGSWAYAKQYDMDVLNLVLSNMYGPEDHFEEERSHALGALIMKFVEAKRNNLPQVVVWGTGTPVREWLHVDDGVEAMIRGMNVARSIDPVNIGVGEGISIMEMAKVIKSIVGYQGKIVTDASKPDGAPYKTVDGSSGRKLFGWNPRIPFDEGVKSTIDWYLNNR